MSIYTANSAEQKALRRRRLHLDAIECNSDGGRVHLGTEALQKIKESLNRSKRNPPSTLGRRKREVPW